MIGTGSGLQGFERNEVRSIRAIRGRPSRAPRLIFLAACFTPILAVVLILFLATVIVPNLATRPGGKEFTVWRTDGDKSPVVLNTN